MATAADACATAPGSAILRTYVLVRTDLPPAAQVVAVAHACLQAGSSFVQPTYSHLVLCAVQDEMALRVAQDLHHAQQTSLVVFYEPGYGAVALCTAPLMGAQQRHFARYPLWVPQGWATSAR